MNKTRLTGSDKQWIKAYMLGYEARSQEVRALVKKINKLLKKLL